MYLNTTKEGSIYSDLCGCFSITSIRGNKNIYIMYVYYCNYILTTEMKNISDKDTIRAFTSLTEDLKIQGINPGFHFMYNKSSTTLKMTMNSMNIKYQLVPPSNHRANNTERYIQTFKKPFITVMCRVDKDFHIQLWEIFLQQAKSV